MLFDISSSISLLHKIRINCVQIFNTDDCLFMIYFDANEVVNASHSTLFVFVPPSSVPSYIMRRNFFV